MRDRSGYPFFVKPVGRKKRYERIARPGNAEVS